MLMQRKCYGKNLNRFIKMEVNISGISFNDIDQILAIENKINKFPWSRANFLSSLNAGHKAMSLIFNDSIIGYTFFYIVDTDAHLLNISIKRSFQKQGMGKKLLTHVIGYAKLSGATMMFLEVAVSNLNAIAFYEKLGFIGDSYRYNYYGTKDKEDALLMSLRGF